MTTEKMKPDSNCTFQLKRIANVSIEALDFIKIRYSVDESNNLYLIIEPSEPLTIINYEN